MELDFDRCYRAVDSRDRRFDGCFVTAVTTTGIYCRPSCPAATPKPKNVEFYPTAAAAHRLGFRACRRCRPDAAPGSPEWDTRADITARAMRLIADGAVDRDGVPGLAGRLGYSSRHLTRLLNDEVGAGPLALARAQRAQTARILIETTDMSMSDIAFAAGFKSIRQFNEALRDIYASNPSELRVGAGRRPRGRAETIAVRLAYRPPLHRAALLEFLAMRAIPGVEVVTDEHYMRAIRLPHGNATVMLTPLADYVSATLHLADVRDLAPAVARCRRLLDLDADPVAVDAVLSADPALAAAIAAEPGVRVPRAVDGFEVAVRAIVGQQVSVASAITVLQRIVEATRRSEGTGNSGPIERSDLTGNCETDWGSGLTGSSETGRDRGMTENSETARQSGLTGNSEAALGSGLTRRSQARGNGPTRASEAAGRDRMAGNGRKTRGSRSDRSGSLARTDGYELMPFPTAEAVAALPDTDFAMPASRKATIKALAAAMASGDLILDSGVDRAWAEQKLRQIPGIGAWTANYVAMRALGDPDTFLSTDVAILRAAGRAGLPSTPARLDHHARRWAPWRSYAVIRLWRM